MKSVGASLVAIVFFLTFSQNLPNEVNVGLVEANENLAINLNYNGDLIQFPYFDSSRISQALREMLVKQSKEFFYQMTVLVEKHISPQTSRVRGWISSTKKFYDVSTSLTKLVNRQKQERTELNEVYRSEAPYKANMKAMFKDISKNAQEIEANLRGQPKDPEELLVDLNKFFDQLNKGFESSETATYVDWPNGKIGDKEFPQVAAELMGRVRFHGFGGVFDVIEKMFSLFMVVKGSKSSSSSHQERKELPHSISL